jgi:iron complex transport system substrate-binding protein
LFFLLAATARAEIALIDDAGNRIVLPRPATRIVSLAPHVTELLFAAGAGDRVVGAVDYSNYPDAARRLPRIGSHAAFDLERIAALKPDLAIGWGSGNPPGQVAQLRRLNIPVFVNEPQRLDDIAASLRQVGVLAGVPGEPAARAFEQRLAELRARHAQAAPVSVFYEIWNQPLMTIGGAHLISAAIGVCGGRNVFAALTQSAANVELEAVLRADPQAIVASGMDTARPEWLDHWRRWPQLKAVKHGNLFFVPPDLLQRHTPRLLDGVEQLCAALEIARQRGR